MGDKYLDRSLKKSFKQIIQAASEFDDIDFERAIAFLQDFKNKLNKKYEERVKHVINEQEAITEDTECIKFAKDYKLYNTPTNPRIFYKNTELRKSYSNGYINVYIKALHRPIGLHRLVYCVNNKIPIEKWVEIEDINHIDCNRTHNNIENLECISHQANCNAKTCHTTKEEHELLSDPRVKKIETVKYLRNNRKDKQLKPITYKINNLAYNTHTREIWQKKDPKSKKYTLIEFDGGYNFYVWCPHLQQYTTKAFGKKVEAIINDMSV